jgi:DNA mismatch repair ATPase MutS
MIGVAIGVGLAYFASDWWGWCAIAVTLVVFNIVAYFHRQIDRSSKRHEIWRVIKRRQIARMRLDWSSIPGTDYQEPDLDHPFEIDLDVTGKCSLLQLVDISISQDGSQRLQAWLLETHPQASVIERQQAVIKELVPLARFRDKLLLAFYLVSKKQLDGRTLLNWVDRKTNPKTLNRVLLASTGLALLNIVLFGLNEFNILPAFWIATFTLYAVIYFMNFDLIDSLLADSNMISDEMRKFREILRYLENYRYGSHNSLRKLCQAFIGPSHRPSKRLRQITWLGFTIGLRMNPIVRALLNVVPWDFFLVNRINKMKSILADDLPIWLEVLTELEASVSLANFAYLNPEYSFPMITTTSDQSPMAFEAHGLGHPLIPDAQRVGNDFSFGEAGEIVLITGSNMSGKSTFLKTVGLNLSLAFAGGPVNASSLRTSSFRLFSCIKINDSVTGGFSFFYAEVRRLKGLLDQLKEEDDQPLLFLIDEIFKGTNNRERLIGSRSYIKSLVGQNGLGMVTTHDLELTNLSEDIPSMSNYHFREEVQNGKMVFDFKLHLGPCPTTNALKIMRLEGLPVKDELIGD